MPASVFQLVGSYVASPSVGAPSAEPDIPAPLDERLNLSRKHYDEVVLTADAFAPVGFGGVTNAHVLVLKSPGARALARLTSADGSQQLVPFGELMIIISRDQPYTSIDVQRSAGVTTTVKAFLGEKA